MGGYAINSESKGSTLGLDFGTHFATCFVFRPPKVLHLQDTNLLRHRAIQYKPPSEGAEKQLIGPFQGLSRDQVRRRIFDSARSAARERSPPEIRDPANRVERL